MLVNGTVGVAGLVAGQLVSVLEATFVDGRIATIEITAGRAEFAALELTFLDA